MTDFFQKGVNYYVPAALGASGIGADELFAADIGTPIATSAIVIANSFAITNLAIAALAITTLPYEIGATFGRNLILKGDTALDDAVVSVYGEDYLGQPIKENFTLAGVTSQVGAKAFKRVIKIATAAGNANASSTIDVGLGLKFGLPYRTNKLLSYAIDGADASVPTLNAPSLTDPGTATTADPRGTVTLSTGDVDGAKRHVFTARVNRALNASGNGGMYGLAHYGG